MTTFAMTTSDSIDNDLSIANSANLLDPSFAIIDWQAPWLCYLNQLNYLSKIIKQLSEQNEQQSRSRSSDQSDHQQDLIAKVLNEALNQPSAYKQSIREQNSLPKTQPITDHQAHVLKFVSQNALSEGQGYEQFIAMTGNIPTRDNLHDLFNGSIWLTFPKTKAILNYHHMLEIAKRSDEQDNSQSRGRVRDTITVFDENGAVLVTSQPSIGEALIDFDWQDSLINSRAHFDNPLSPKSSAQAAVYIFGHALLEQLIEPRKPLCAHSVVIHVRENFFSLSTAERIHYLDNTLAEYMDKLLSQHEVTPRQLAPLPILGVPHFWSENSDPSFYDDAYVFRSGRHRQKSR